MNSDGDAMLQFSSGMSTFCYDENAGADHPTWYVSIHICTVEGKSKWHHQVFQNSFHLKR